MKFIFILSSFLIVLLTASCAGVYRSQPTDQYLYDFHQSNRNDSIRYYFVDNILYRNKCRKYAREEKRKRASMVAVRIENRGRTPIVLKHGNVKVFNENEELRLYYSREYYRLIKQKPGFFMFWSFMPYGGVIYGSVNAIVAARANKKLSRDIATNDLIGKVIPPRQAVTGYLFISRPRSWDLKLSVNRTDD